MNNKLPQKISDYERYAIVAQRHYNSSLYSDAALNCRKACEAACKVIIYNAYNENLADAKVEYCNLKDLISLVIKDGLVKREIINWLECLQILGNKAAHDNIITKEEANYSIAALNFLTKWLYKECLKMNIPGTLLNDDSETILLEPSIIEKIIIQEKISQETEDQLLNRVQAIIDEKNKLNEAKSKLDEDTISELKRSLDETNKEINTLKASNVESDRKEVEIPVKETSYKKWWIISGFILLISSIAFILWKPTQKLELFTTPIAKNGDTIYIAINDFNILQDNPNSVFKIESLLQTYIERISTNNNLPFKISHIQLKQTDLINDTSIINHAERLGYDLIYFANLYETALSDSNIIELNGSACNINNRNNRSKKIKFKNLTDSTLIKELNDQANISAFYFAQQPEKITEGISVLNSLTYYSTENRDFALYIKTNSNWKSKNYKAALTDITQLLVSLPKSVLYNSIKADIFIQLNRFDSSEVYCKKALQMDSTDSKALLILAKAYQAQNKEALSETTLLKVIQLEPFNEEASDCLSLLYHYKANPQLAKEYALKTHQINSQNTDANFVLAEYYAYDEVRKDSAEYYYSMLLQKDSSFVQGLNSLANYYLKYYPTKTSQAKYLLEKAKQKNAEVELSNIYGLGVAAYNEHDYQKCIFYLEEAYNKKVFSNDLAKYLTLSYYNLGNYPKAMFYAQKGIQYDSINSANLHNYAVMLSVLEPDNIKKVSYYFNKALLNHSDPLILKKQFASYLNAHRKYKEALNIMLPLYNTNRNDLEINQCIADAYLGLLNFQAALNYLEYLNIAQPKNDLSKAQLSYVLLKVNKDNKEQFARGISLVKEATIINPKNIEAHLLYANYMFILGKSFILQKNLEQANICKKVAKKEYLFAKGLNKTIFVPDLEKFIN